MFASLFIMILFLFVKFNLGICFWFSLSSNDRFRFEGWFRDHLYGYNPFHFLLFEYMYLQFLEILMVD